MGDSFDIVSLFQGVCFVRVQLEIVMSTTCWHLSLIRSSK